MNGKRGLTLDSAMNGHSSMTGTLTDYKGSRPNNLHPGDRKFPDQERANLWSPCSNCSSDENNSPTALNTFNWDKPALEDKSVDFGWSMRNDKGNDINKSAKPKCSDTSRRKTGVNLNGYANFHSDDTQSSAESRKSKHKHSPERERNRGESCRSDSPVQELYPTKDAIDDLTNEFQQITDIRNGTLESVNSESERSEEDIIKEKEDLRNVAWFQAGIPREIALEVLAEKPEGSFIVRESTTKPDCYALSLRVPPGKNPDGIAHYLILRTNKGYKIKGFTKEFSSLNALITHHSVMPEMLPCPLSLSQHSTRDAEQEFEDVEQKTCDIFTDIHWIMTDLEK